MNKNVKMSELINLSVTFEKGGYDKYKTKYDPENTEFLVGRRKDFKIDDHEAEGNFEVAKPIKGQSPDTWEWKTVPYDRQKYAQTYSYLVKADGVEGWVELSWSANEAFKKTVGVNDWGKAKLPATVKVKRPDKAYEFELIKSVEPKNNDADFPDAPQPDDLPF